MRIRNALCVFLLKEDVIVLAIAAGKYDFINSL